MKPYTLDDAEEDLREALTNNVDATTLDTLAALIDRLEAHPPTTTLHSAALWYAEQGLHVFPLSPGSKIPHKGSRGCKDATSDPEQVNRWWQATPEANIGVATGHLIDVVDIDGHTGQTSRCHHGDLFTGIEAHLVGKVLTPRPGGMHLWVPATGAGNSTNIVASVDYRGRGGYVVAPPSRTEIGTYRWLQAPVIPHATDLRVGA